MSTRVLRVPPGLRHEQLDDELLLYREETARVVALNPTASLIWELCDGRRSLGEIETLLRGAFPEAADRIPGELAAAVEHLLGEQVLEVSEDESG